MKLNVKHINLAILAAAFLALSITACNKDDEGDSTSDLTVQVQGTYEGDYTEVASGSGITLNEIEAEITRESNGSIAVSIKVLGSLVSLDFKGDMTDETTFTVPAFTYDDRTLSGTGSLENGASLKIELQDEADENFAALYEGEKN